MRLQEIQLRLDALSLRGLEGYSAREHFQVHAEADIEFLLYHCEQITEMVKREQYWRLRYETALKEVRTSNGIYEAKFIADTALKEDTE